VGEPRLAAIGTFYRRPWAVPRIAQFVREQTRPPDELILTYEDADDGKALRAAKWGVSRTTILSVGRLVPRDEHGRFTEIAPCIAINAALDLTDADYITYLTDDSLPLPDKYRQMHGALREHGAVYCSQDYGSVGSPEEWLAGGGSSGLRRADHVESDPFCRVDHTQVAHRSSPDRWPTSMQFLRFSDGEFFKALVVRFGGLYPIPDILDWTRMLPDGISANPGR